MTTITIERELLEQALANMVRAELLYGQPNQAIQEAIRAALAAPATAPDEIEQLRKDAERYQWLAEYLVSDDESYDDAIVAATTVKEVGSVIDNAMGASPWAHCFCGVRPQAQHVWQAAAIRALKETP